MGAQARCDDKGTLGMSAHLGSQPLDGLVFNVELRFEADSASSPSPSVPRYRARGPQRTFFLPGFGSVEGQVRAPTVPSRSEAAEPLQNLVSPSLPGCVPLEVTGDGVDECIVPGEL